MDDFGDEPQLLFRKFFFIEGVSRVKEKNIVQWKVEPSLNQYITQTENCCGIFFFCIKNHLNMAC